jgi:hypothetical protein
MLLLNGWRLRRLARARGAQLIHLNYNLTGYVARFFSLGRLRVLTHVRFLPQTLPQPLARTWRWLAEHAAQQVLCVSEAVRSYFAPDPVRIRTVYDPLPARLRLHFVGGVMGMGKNQEFRRELEAAAQAMGLAEAR